MQTCLYKYLAVFSLSLALGTGKSLAGDSGDSDDVLETLSGKVFHDVRVVQIDPNGVVFRHRGGAAKVRIDDLDPKIIEFLGLDEKKAAAFEKAHSVAMKRAAQSKKPAKTIEGGESAAAPVDVILTTRTIVRIPVRDPYADARAACGGVPWHFHWARFHPGLAYAHFPCRQLAERDFLISSGILPTPPGVRMHRVYR